MTRQEFEEWAATPEGWSVIRPLVDRATTKGIRTHDAKLSAIRDKEIDDLKAQLADAQDPAGRLDRLEVSFDRRVAEIKREYEVKARCLEQGVDYKILQGYQFDDLEQVDAKIEAIRARDQELANRAVRERLGSSHQPMSGLETDDDGPKHGTREMDRLVAEFERTLG